MSTTSRSKKRPGRFFLRDFGGAWPSRHPCFQTSSLQNRESKLYHFKPPTLWYLIQQLPKTKTGNCGLRGQKPMWRKALGFAWSQVCEPLQSEDGGVLLGLKWEDNAAIWRPSGCRAAQDASSVCIGNGPACLRTMTVSGECAVSLSLQRPRHLEGTPASSSQSLFAQHLMKDLSQSTSHIDQRSQQEACFWE